MLDFKAYLPSFIKTILKTVLQGNNLKRDAFRAI